MSRRRRALAVAAGVVVVAAAIVTRRSTKTHLRTGRGQRNTDVAKLGAAVGANYAGTAARKLFASAERRIELDEARELKTAEAVAERLGNMKGALMKLGQMASYVDEALPGSAARGARPAAVERTADERASSPPR